VAEVQIEVLAEFQVPQAAVVAQEQEAEMDHLELMEEMLLIMAQAAEAELHQAALLVEMASKE
jgi:hypothetical protein